MSDDNILLIYDIAIGLMMASQAVAIYFLIRRGKIDHFIWIGIAALAFFLVDAINHITWIFYHKILSEAIKIAGATIFLSFFEFYVSQLQWLKFSRYLRIILYVILILVSFTIWNEDFNNHNIDVIRSITFSILSVSLIIKMIAELKYDEIHKQPLFLVNSAIFIYSSGNLFLMLIFEPLARVNPMAASFAFLFHNFLAVCMFVIFSVAFEKSRLNE